MRAYPLEHTEQVHVFHWAAAVGKLYPEIALLFAIPNGGHRNLLVARKMKAEGVKAGVPDMFLPVARGGFHGMFLELKTEVNRPKRGGKGGLSDLQTQWLADLRDQGYRAEVAYGAREAIAMIEGYLTQDDPTAQRI